jgi:hypothetical protein
MMCNFQMSGKGGEGFFRLLTFNMETETVNIETYSSLLDETKTVSEHQFNFDFDIFDYVNDIPAVRNDIQVFEMYEDQEAGYLDLDGNLRPNTGIFHDINHGQGDELKFDVWTGDEWFWVGLGRPLDMDGTTITYMPNGTFEITNPENWFGSYELKIRARDKRDGEVNTSVTVEVSPVNDAPLLLATSTWSFEEPVPTIDSDIITCSEDERLGFTLGAEDPVEPGDDLSFHLFSVEWYRYSFDNGTGRFSFDPHNEDVGRHLITFGVSDGKDMTTREILIKVTNVNDPPMIMTKELAPVQEDEEYSFSMEALDVDPTEDRLTWALEMEEEMLVIDERTGEITGTAGNDQVGAHEVKITVTDEHGGADSRTYTVIVNNTNDAPHIVMTPYTFFMDEDTIEYFEIGDWFSDIDGDVLTYSIGSAEGFEFDLLDNDTIRIVPRANWSGSGTLEVTAFDGIADATDSFRIMVEPVNDAPFDPMVEVDMTTVVEGGSIRANASAMDVDIDYGDELTFAWFSNRTGRIGVGKEMDLTLPAGHHRITMTATDEAGEFVQYDVDLIITPKPVNETPDDDDDDTDPADNRGSGSITIIIGVSISLVLLILVGAGILLFLRKRKEEPEVRENGSEHPFEEDRM